jgi:hypothetical protein
VSMTERIVTRPKPRLRRDLSFATEIKEVTSTHARIRTHTRNSMYTRLWSYCFMRTPIAKIYIVANHHNNRSTYVEIQYESKQGRQSQ